LTNLQAKKQLGDTIQLKNKNVKHLSQIPNFMSKSPELYSPNLIKKVKIN
jgi:hypothetical protein